MRSVIRVGVLGAAGRMGRAICRALEATPDLALVAAVDPAFGLGAEGPVHGSSAAGPIVSGDLDALEAGGAEVVVDFTHADAARENLPWCASKGIHAVVGTTGLVDADLERLAVLFDGEPANAVVAPNFAIGAVLLMRLCELVAPYMDGAEVVELHHDAKRDAPSGTAMQTAARIAAARRAAGRPDFGPDPTVSFVLDGARGGAGEGGVRLHSVRLHGLVAHQEVLFGAAGQSLTLRHDSYDLECFMPGIVLAVRAVPDRKGLTVGLDEILGA